MTSSHGDSTVKVVSDDRNRHSRPNMVHEKWAFRPLCMK